MKRTIIITLFVAISMLILAYGPAAMDALRSHYTRQFEVTP